MVDSIGGMVDSGSPDKLLHEFLPTSQKGSSSGVTGKILIGFHHDIPFEIQLHRIRKHLPRVYLVDDAGG